MDTRKSRRSPPPMAAGVATVSPPSAGCATDGAYRLLLRVYAAEHLRGVSSHGTYCKLYVGNVDMAASRKGRQSFKRFLLATSLSSTSNNNHSSSSISSTSSTPSSSFSSNGGSSPDVLEADVPSEPQPQQSHYEPKGLDTTGARVREFKTQVHKFSRVSPVWNEKFEVPGVDATRDLVSIRVKSARLMSSPAVGACCIALHDVPADETVDRWVDLLDGKKSAGRIRVQLRLVSLTTHAVKKESRSRHRSGAHSSRSRSHDNQDPATDDDDTNNSNKDDRSARCSNRSSTSSLSRTRLSGSVSPVSQQPPNGHAQFATDPQQQRPRGTIVVTAAPTAANSPVIEFTDDEADDVEALGTYDTFQRINRSTMLSDIGAQSNRSHGASFVGSLHLYNRNSIATSTPSSRTTMVMTEAEIAALSRESALAVRRSRRHRPLGGHASAADDRLSSQTEYDDTASDFDDDDDDDDDDDSEPETEGPRIPWSSTITRLLTRKSMNVLMDEDDDDEYDDDNDDACNGGIDGLDSAGRITDDIVPIMDFPGTPQDIDDIDCA